MNIHSEKSSASFLNLLASSFVLIKNRLKMIARRERNMLNLEKKPGLRNYLLRRYSSRSATAILKRPDFGSLVASYCTFCNQLNLVDYKIPNKDEDKEKPDEP